MILTECNCNPQPVVDESIPILLGLAGNVPLMMKVLFSGDTRNVTLTILAIHIDESEVRKK